MKPGKGIRVEIRPKHHESGSNVFGHKAAHPIHYAPNPVFLTQHTRWGQAGSSTTFFVHSERHTHKHINKLNQPHNKLNKSHHTLSIRERKKNVDGYGLTVEKKCVVKRRDKQRRKSRIRVGRYNNIRRKKNRGPEGFFKICKKVESEESRSVVVVRDKRCLRGGSGNKVNVGGMACKKARELETVVM